MTVEEEKKLILDNYKKLLKSAQPFLKGDDAKVIKKCKKNIKIEITTKPEDAIKNADIVMTDTFTSIHNIDKKREKKFLPTYQVNTSLMKKAKRNALFMHCLPAKRGKEVTSSVIDGPQSVIWDQAENRLHTQKALLISLLGI